MKEYTRRQYEDLFAPVMEGPAGAAVAVLDGDRVLFEHFYGLANLEHQVPVTSRTVFPLSSVTKQFTAMLILLLVEGGRLEYETMLSASLPEFAAYEPDITLRQLLHHTSGLPDPYAYFAARDISTYGVTNADILKSFVGSTPLSFEPGTAFEYSNLNYIALAQLAETACGQPLRHLFTEYLFEPLGMKNTQLLDRRRVIPNRAYGYREEREEVRTVDCRWLTYGDGGLLSSLRDLQVWVRGLSAGELVCEEVLELAFTSGRTSDGTATGYGFGWQLRELQGGAGQAVYHAGGDPGFGSLIWRFPAEDLCILALSNLDESWRQMMEIVRGVEAKMS